MKGFPDLPPIWFAASWLLILIVGRLTPDWATPIGGHVSLGWGFTLTGLSLILWAAFWFWRKRTTIEPHHKATTLLVEGPYRISRNPIYLGLAVILAGSIIGRGIWFGIPVLIGFIAIIQKRFVVPEEAGLREVFGAEADAYLAKTRAWI